MTEALTETIWLTTLRRIVATTDNDTTRTLARMLHEIIEAPGDMPEILDTYGRHLMGER